MPRLNRVTPFGDIIATPERGNFMGNRDVLHGDNRNIRRSWQLKRWLVCMLEFRDRHPKMMTPNRYTELFFLDEVTALAAGNRPCAECRHTRFLDFCPAWAAVSRGTSRSQRPTADEIDRRLHAERLAPHRSNRTFSASLNDLSDGVFIHQPAWARTTISFGAADYLPGPPTDTPAESPDPKPRLCVF